MALHGVSDGVVSSYSGWLNWYEVAAICVLSHRLPLTLPRLLHEDLVAY